MGWFLVTIIVPLAAPMVFMLLSRLFPIPSAAAARTNLLIPVQDGQLGWLALAYAASCTYEVYTYVAKVGDKAESWVHFVLASALITIVAAAYMAAIGVLFPRKVAHQLPVTFHGWVRRYSAFLATGITVLISIVLYGAVHYLLPVAT